jgi:hypothetical protein
MALCRAGLNGRHVVGDRHRSAGSCVLARFYSDLLGWPVGHQEPGTAILAAALGATLATAQPQDDQDPSYR